MTTEHISEEVLEIQEVNSVKSEIDWFRLTWVGQTSLLIFTIGMLALLG